MATCSKCNRGRCSCKKVTIFDDRPEIIKNQTIPVPGEDGPQGPEGDTYIASLTDNFFEA